MESKWGLLDLSIHHVRDFIRHLVCKSQFMPSSAPDLSIKQNSVLTTCHNIFLILTWFSNDAI